MSFFDRSGEVDDYKDEIAKLRASLLVAEQMVIQIADQRDSAIGEASSMGDVARALREELAAANKKVHDLIIVQEVYKQGAADSQARANQAESSLADMKAACESGKCKDLMDLQMANGLMLIDFKKIEAENRALSEQVGRMRRAFKKIIEYEADVELSESAFYESMWTECVDIATQALL